MNQLYKLIGGFIVVSVLILGLLSCSKSTVPELVVIDKPGLPVVYFRVMVNAGSAYDPDGKPGLAYFTANLLNKGTVSYSREEIEERLDQIGARLSISVDKEVVVISARTLKENLEVFYPIFKEILTAPSFPAGQITLVKSEQLDQLGRLREDDAALSLAVLENRLFEGHRYGHVIQGSESAVKAFTKEDAASFYKQQYLQGNIFAGIAGAVDDSLVARFKSDLASLPGGSVVRVRSSALPSQKKSVMLIEKENRAQSHLRVGHLLDFNRTSEDYYPMRLVRAYLGEHREGFGRLYQTIRKQRGLAYGAYAYIEYFRQAGWSKLQDNGINRYDQYFHMWTYPKAVNYEYCIKQMLEEMTKLTAEDVSEDDFRMVQDYVANKFAFLTETPDKQLGMKLDELWYGIDGFVDDYEDNITSVDHNQFFSVAKRYLKPQNILIVAVVSNGEAAKRELLTIETTLELPSGVAEGEYKEINEQVKAFDLGLTVNDIEIIRASDLFK